MPELKVFTDGSVNPKTGLGFGAFLVVKDITLPLEVLSRHVRVKQFENTSSTKLELQTLLWAAAEVCIAEAEVKPKINFYCDSANVIGLASRRKALESNNYYSRSGKRLNNFELYRQFFKLMDEGFFHVFKIEGHKPLAKKNIEDKIFTLVDKASRGAMRASDCGSV